MTKAFRLDELSEIKDRYDLEECIGEGLYGMVFRAADKQAQNRKVAIKIQNFIDDNVPFIQEEYRIFRDYSSHPNLPDFYGIFKNTKKDGVEIWFVMELCEGGPVTDLVKGLLASNRRMGEEHIAFILKELVKVLTYLHENKVMHRDVRGSNVLLTKDGEVKLVDFGLARLLSSTFGKSTTCLGSPSWMAPEVVSSTENQEEEGYDNRADVWSLGIVGIELADGKAPFQNMHPTRAMFQIVRNPPPMFEKPANWSMDYNDFVNECLVKTPEHRPFIQELVEHPFLGEVPENTYVLCQELRHLIDQYSKKGTEHRYKETVVQANLMKQEKDKSFLPLLVEDLASLDNMSEKEIIHQLRSRMKAGQFYTFIGDILLSINPNEEQKYTQEHHVDYMYKSRSDNVAHIYAIADSAYQSALHHETTQHILLSGESSSGKTTNYLHLIDHLLFLGHNININQKRIKEAIQIIHAFVNASTPINDNSTRCAIQTKVTFGKSGKNTGAYFTVNLIDRWRVSCMDMSQANFHIFYYFYDGLKRFGELNRYDLDDGRKYRYLRISQGSGNSQRPIDNPTDNAKTYRQIRALFRDFEFKEDQIFTIESVLAAILNLGDVRFKEDDGNTRMENETYAERVADLLKVDKQKFLWALKNYCLVSGGTAIRKRQSCEEARDSRDVLANTLYIRIIQYIVQIINQSLSYGRRIFGDKYFVKILDMNGFECFRENHYPQFLINCLNEQMQYHYLLRVFGWENVEANEEDIPYSPIRYYNNKQALNEMLGSSGFLALIDKATRENKTGKSFLESLKDFKGSFVRPADRYDFLVNHYAGKIRYTAREMPDFNREFLPPEIVDVMASSGDPIIKTLFSCKVNEFGNIQFPDSEPEDDKGKKQFVQQKSSRTTAANFKAFCVNMLKEVSVGGGTGGTQFVRCVRPDLIKTPGNFYDEVVRQQLRGLAVIESAKAKQRGFPHRVPFVEFLKRYKFLAFDFDENVDMTKDNCRLLLIRLKMEGWGIGKTKVFLKYYNEEYLSRLYETNVKKVIKIQAMIRSYLAKRKMAKKTKKPNVAAAPPHGELEGKFTEDEAATVIQKNFRKYCNKKQQGKISEGKFDKDLLEFIRQYYNRWRSKSLYQVLLQYRALKFQDLYNLSQQVHLYNQYVFHNMQQIEPISLKSVDTKARIENYLSCRVQAVSKLPFRLDEIPFFDTTYMCESSFATERCDFNEEESWDAAFQWRESVSQQITDSFEELDTVEYRQENQLIEIPYTRDPSNALTCLPAEDAYYSSVELPGRARKSPALRVTDTSRHNTDNVCSPANNDFEFIRPPSQGSRPPSRSPKPAEFTNPIAELEQIGKFRKTSDITDEDPPYNFQAMLRKTNYQRDCNSSDFRAQNGPGKSSRVEVPVNLKSRQNGGDFSRSEGAINHMDTRRNNLDDKFSYYNKSKSTDAFSNSFSMNEICPGLYMEGIVMDI